MYDWLDQYDYFISSADTFELVGDSPDLAAGINEDALLFSELIGVLNLGCGFTFEFLCLVWRFVRGWMLKYSWEVLLEIFMKKKIYIYLWNLLVAWDCRGIMLDFVCWCLTQFNLTWFSVWLMKVLIVCLIPSIGIVQSLLRLCSIRTLAGHFGRVRSDSTSLERFEGSMSFVWLLHGKSEFVRVWKVSSSCLL